MAPALAARKARITLYIKLLARGAECQADSILAYALSKHQFRACGTIAFAPARPRFFRFFGEAAAELTRPGPSATRPEIV
jgi:hypothetical protein